MKAAALLFLAGGLQAYIPQTGSPYKWTDYRNIRMLLNDSTRPGMKNSPGRTMITTDSDPVQAIQAALSTWNSIPGSAARFAPLQMTRAGSDSPGDLHVITFQDTPANRSVIGSALAVTVTWSDDSGAITDSDILFNPDETFSTTLAPNTFDIQSVATHELGHLLGANHSTVLSATMFQSTPPGTNQQALPQPDDISFVTDFYPAGGGDPQFGGITGFVRKNGAAVRHASVIAIDPATGIVLCGLSNSTDGAYAIRRVPPGAYFVYAEPLSGVVGPDNLDIADATVDTDFQIKLGPRITVTAGQPSTADIAVPGGGSSPRFRAVGTGDPGGSGDYTHFGLAAFPVRTGTSTDIVMTGPGLGSGISEANIRLIGPGLNIRPGSVRADPNVTFNGSPLVRFTVDVDLRHATGAASLIVMTASGSASLSGGLMLLAGKPAVTAEGIVNAASSIGGGVAPGEIVALYGLGVGPALAMATTGYSGLTGALPSSLGSVRVTFDGAPAPLFFVSENQINLQVPYEVAGRSSTRVVVTSQGAASDSVSVPVRGAQPGVFSVILNGDGALNSPSQPAGRGTFVTLFATGQGLVQPAVATGAPASASPLSTAAATSVTIGGMTGAVFFSGLAPGLVGLWQINVGVPDSAVPADAAPVEVTIGGIRSAAGVTVALK